MKSRYLNPSLLALLIGHLLLGGCTLSWTHFGHPLRAGAESTLYQGQPKSDVLEQLGPPDRVAVERAESTFEYLYREQRDRELDISLWQANFNYQQGWDQADRLVIRFDARGQVRDYAIIRATRAKENALPSPLEAGVENDESVGR